MSNVRSLRLEGEPDVTQVRDTTWADLLNEAAGVPVLGSVEGSSSEAVTAHVTTEIHAELRALHAAGLSQAHCFRIARMEQRLTAGAVEEAWASIRGRWRGRPRAAMAGIDEDERPHETRRGRVAEAVQSGRLRRRAQIWVDVDGDARDSDDDVEVASRGEAVRRPRYERDMRDVNMDEEAELRRLEGR